jgi:hypothetical protein
VPGGINIVDWLCTQPGFDDNARSLGVRFVGLCRQTLVSLDTSKFEKENAKILKPIIKLSLPKDFPIDEVDIEFRSLPKEKPEDDELILPVFEKAKSSLFLHDADVLVVRFELTNRVLQYVHDELPEFMKIKPENPQEGEISWLWAYQSALQYLATFIVRHLVVYSNICKAGSIDLQDGFVLVGKERRETRSYQGPLNYVSQLETERGIKLLRELDFRKNWEFYINLKGTFLGNPKSPIEIAVSNLTDLFDDSYDQSGARNLIWGFAGLEAILADSEASIGSQLRQKLVALFGNQVDVGDFEKEIGDIYKFRSKIIHGKAKSSSVLKNMSSKFFQSGDEGQETKVAIWLLVALIQYCFQNKQSELKFKTVVL